MYNRKLVKLLLLQALFTEPFYIAPPKKKRHLKNNSVYTFQGLVRLIRKHGVQYLTYGMSRKYANYITVIAFKPS